MSDGVEIRVRREPQGPDYRDQFVIEKVFGEHPDEYVEEIWRGYEHQFRDIHTSVVKFFNRQL